MKKRVLTLGVIAICFLAFACGIMSSDIHATSDNNANPNDVSIALEEKAVTSDGRIIAFNDSADRFNVVPGQSISKIVRVKNTGKKDVNIRVRIDKAIYLADDKTEIPDIDLISLDINREDWTERDGYYYYNVALKPGELTKPIFENAIFDVNMGNEYQGSSARIDVIAQGTKANSNEDYITPESTSIKKTGDRMPLFILILLLTGSLLGLLIIILVKKSRVD